MSSVAESNIVLYDSPPSTFTELCRSLCFGSSIMSIIFYYLHKLQLSRYQLLSSANVYHSIDTLYNALIRSNNTAQYITLTGNICSTQPIYSWYHTSTVPLQLIYRQIKQITTYIKFIPLLRIPGGQYKDIKLLPATTVDSQLLPTNQYHHNTINNTNIVSNTYKSYISNNNRHISIDIPKLTLLRSEHMFTADLNTQQLIGTHTEYKLQSYQNILYDIYHYGRLLKHIKSDEYGIMNGTQLTVVGQCKLSDDQKSITILPPGESIGPPQLTILTDKSYHKLLSDESKYTDELDRVKYFWYILNIASITTYGIYKYIQYRHKQYTLQRITQLQQEREQRRLAQNNTNNNNMIINECVVCTVNPGNCVFLDCFHQCCCIECSEQLIARRYSCPVCRAKIIKYRVPIVV